MGSAPALATGRLDHIPVNAPAGRTSLRVLRRTSPDVHGPIDRLDGHCPCGGGCPGCSESAYPIRRELLADRGKNSAEAEAADGGTCGGQCPACAEKAQDSREILIGSADDQFERDADRVADRVLAGFPPDPILPATPPPLQRACSCGGSRNEEGGKCGECKALDLRRKAAGSALPAAARQAVERVLASPGRSLESPVRGAMGACFGRDLSDVRVHTDTQAAESAPAVGAVAYTVGRDIVFAAGRYAPETAGGKRLLAHELTHIFQHSVRSPSAATLRRQSAAGGLVGEQVEPRRDMQQETESTSEGLAAEAPSARDVIDPRIDVRAQFALLRLFKGPPGQASVARSLFDEVKSGRLNGIFGDDLQVSAKLAAERGTVRWELVPPGQDAVRIDDGGPGAPIVVFKEQAGSAPRLDQALLSVAQPEQGVRAAGQAVPSGGIPIGALSGIVAAIPIANLAGILGGLPPLKPKGGGFKLGTPEICTTVGGRKLLGETKGSAFGVIAERFVDQDFIDRLKPNPLTVFFDQAGIGGGTKTVKFADFIAQHNGLSGAREQAWRQAIGGKRPDIALHGSLPNEQEFYDVKPDNSGGRSDGRVHLKEIEDALTGTPVSLVPPYRRGLGYAPTPEILMNSITIATLPVKAILKLRRADDRLIVYQVCLRGDGVPVLVLALGLAGLLLLVLGPIAASAGGGAAPVLIPIPL